MRRGTILLLGLAAAAVAPTPASGQCVQSWDVSIGQPGLLPGPVHGLAVFDDGSGPAVFAGGFSGSRGQWNGLRKLADGEWISIAPGLVGGVRALTVFDDGSGPALFVGGSFQNAGDVPNTKYIAKWNGSVWSALEEGTDNGVSDLAVLDDLTGSGPQLYVVGGFNMAGSVKANRIARWDGTSWHALGLGFDGEVWDAMAFDDGSGDGAHIYAAGEFLASGRTETRRLARWINGTWEEVGGGTNARIFTMAVFDDGSGPALFVGGEFSMAGGTTVNNIARWDGKTWSDVGGGVNNRLRDLAVFNDGVVGFKLYATGRFSTAGSNDLMGIARWSGSEWTELGNGLSGGDGGIKLLETDLRDGHGPALYVGGEFTDVDDIPTSYAARLITPLSDIVQQPASQSVQLGVSVTLSVEVIALETATFQWRRDGAPVLDGGNVSGSQSPTLTINPVGLQNAGTYDVMVTTDSCTNVSDPAIVVVTDPCPGDIDDNQLVDVDDLLLVINLWGPCNGPPFICAYTDIQPAGGNGIVDVDDLLVVINDWGKCQ